MDLIRRNAEGIQDVRTFNMVNAALSSGLRIAFGRGIDRQKAHETTSLDMRARDYQGLVDLDFLRFFPNLESLFIVNGFESCIVSIEGLKYAKKIKHAEIISRFSSGNFDISVLGDCSELELLNFMRTGKKSVDVTEEDGESRVLGFSEIVCLKKLRILCFSGFRLEGIECIAGITSLRDIDFCHTGLTDISFLSGLSGLEDIGLEHNSIKDFSPLVGLKNLRSLHATNNGLSEAEIEKWAAEFSHVAHVRFELTDEERRAEIKQERQGNWASRLWFCSVIIAVVGVLIFRINIPIAIGLLAFALVVHISARRLLSKSLAFPYQA